MLRSSSRHLPFSKSKSHARSNVLNLTLDVRFGRALGLVRPPRWHCYSFTLSAKKFAMATSSSNKTYAHKFSAPASPEGPSPMKERKATGRAFWERMGKPKWVLAPMVDQSEFVCFFLGLPWPLTMLMRA